MTPLQIPFDLWLIVKGMFVFGMVLYVVFASVVVRQVEHMTKTLQVGFELPIRVLAIFHALASIFLLILSIVIL